VFSSPDALPVPQLPGRGGHPEDADGMLGCGGTGEFAALRAVCWCIVSAVGEMPAARGECPRALEAMEIKLFA